MNYQALLDRILQSVDSDAYEVETSHLDAAQRQASEDVLALVRDPATTPETVRARIEDLALARAIDPVVRLSLLHILAASPKVKDYALAGRLVGEQEVVALQLGGPHLQARLASVDRHRGVLCFLIGAYDQALDHFARALERERSAMNLQNVLATLLRLGQEAHARTLLGQIHQAYPADVVSRLDHAIARDPDLALLRSEE